MMMTVFSTSLLIVTLFSCVVLLLSVECQNSTSGRKPDMYLLVLAPFPHPTQPDKSPTFSEGPSILHAVQLALEHINNSPKLLQNHTLDIVVGDSGCNFFSRSAIPFVENLLFGDKPILGIVGPSCSEASLFLAEITKGDRYGVVHAVMTNTDALDNHQRYRHTFGMISSFNILIEAVINISIAEEQSWTSVGVLYDSSRAFFQSILSSFLARFPNPSIEYWPIFVDPLEVPLDEITRNFSTRVILAIMGKRLASHLACLAGIKGITYPIYQFIYLDRTIEEFLGNDPKYTIISDGHTYQCNKTVIAKGLNGSILIRYALNSTDSRTFLEPVQLTVGEIKDQYVESLQKSSQNLSQTVYAFSYYDAILAFALSIDKVIKELGDVSRNNLKFFNNNLEAEAIRQAFSKVNFQGLASQVQFNKTTGHLKSEISIFQVNDMGIIQENITYIPDQFKKDYLTLHPALIAYGFIFSVLAFTLNAGLHIASVYYRENSSVKATSPRLNHIIFIGCYLMIVSVVVQTVHYGFIKKNELGIFLCTLPACLNPICLTIIIGTLLGKLWRLYSIFHRSFKKQHLLHDKYLALIVLGLVTIVILLEIPWLISAPYTEQESIDTYISVGLETVIHIDRVCLTSTNMNYLVVLPYLFIFILLTAMFMLAYLNRKIKINQFRSGEVIIFVYLLTVSLGLAASAVAVVNIIQVGQNINYLINNTLFIFLVFLCDLILFVPSFYFIARASLNSPASSEKLSSFFKTTTDKVIYKQA